MTAAPGSTHGYDVADPTTVDPVLGGKAGLLALAEQARDAGIGIILDIVPNHTVCSPDNIWLRDVLRFGPTGCYGGHFDIDWSRGPLPLPFLPDDFETCVAEGLLRLDPGANGHGAIAFDGSTVPLAPRSWGGRSGTDPGALAYHHDRQFWRLTQGGVAARIRHRRFFNVTELIGMRIGEPQVFDGMHAGLFPLIDAGVVQGLRVDHIDGLADPATYLAGLSQRVGDMPVWIEKILTGDETLPNWQTLGTTGYEAGRAITQVLTNPAKLLIDPYARKLTDQLAWDDALFGYTVGTDDLTRDDRDSAPFIPKGVAVDDTFDWEADQALSHRWEDTVIYEAHVKGLTQTHPDTSPGPTAGRSAALPVTPLSTT